MKIWQKEFRTFKIIKLLKVNLLTEGTKKFLNLATKEELPFVWFVTERNFLPLSSSSREKALPHPFPGPSAPLSHQEGPWLSGEVSRLSIWTWGCEGGAPELQGGREEEEQERPRAKSAS